MIVLKSFLFRMIVGAIWTLGLMFQHKQLSCNDYREKAYGVVRDGFWNYWIFIPKDPESELEVSR